MRKMVQNLIVATGEYELKISEKLPLKVSLSKYLVSTEKAKPIKMAYLYPDKDLMGPLRNITKNARQSIRKRAIEETNYAGSMKKVKLENKKKQ